MIADSVFFHNLQESITRHSSPGIRPGLDRMKILLTDLGNPQDSFKAVHIVGTNGKGSTSAFLSGILACSGYKTATYTSPHLENLGERLLLNGRTISREKWALSAEKVFQTIEDNKILKNDRPSFFETLTAISFLLISDENVDVAIVEAGMGGRLDATNTMGHVILTIITSIAMDHAAFLGNDLLSIAEEKFAVIRDSGRALFYGQNRELERRFLQIGHQKGCLCTILLDQISISHILTGVEGTEYSLLLHEKKLSNHIRTIMPGIHQVYNSALAILAAHELKSSFPDIDQHSIELGIFQAKWPGRMEVISLKPVVILDGAHNKQGIEALVSSLNSIFDYNSRDDLVFVYTSMSDKEYDSGLKDLSECGSGIILTEIPGNTRCETAEKLLETASLFEWRRKPSSITDPFKAVQKACSEAGIVVICGSLYLIGFIRNNLIKEFHTIHGDH